MQFDDITHLTNIGSLWQPGDPPPPDPEEPDDCLESGTLPMEKDSAQTPAGVPAESIFSAFRTGAEFAATVIPDVAWVFHGYVSRGDVTELTGKVKQAGKTTFALAMCEAVLNGHDFLGRTCARGPVIYATEQGDSSFRESLRRAGILGHADLHILSWHRIRRYGWSQIVALIADYVRHVGAIAVVIDTIGRWANVAGDAENSAGAAGEVMGPIKELAASRNVGVLILRHARKSGGDVGDDGRGSSAYSGDADTLVSLRFPEGNHGTDSPYREVAALGRFDETPSRLIIELVDRRYICHGEQRDIEATKAQQSIRTLLRPDGDPITFDDICAGSLSSRTTLQAELQKLVQSGEVERIGKGKRGDPFRFQLKSAEKSFLPIPEPEVLAETNFDSAEALPDTTIVSAETSSFNGQKPILLIQPEHDDSDLPPTGTEDADVWTF